jgi:translocation and assembly module TamB
MQRLIRWILWSVIGFLALPLLGLMLMILAADSQFGRTSIERAVSIFSAEQVVISGLDGNFFGELTIKRIELHDSSGPWLTIDELMLNWLPIKLFAGEVAIERLQVRRIALAHLPATTAAEPKTPGKLSLPLAINLRSLLIERLEIPPSLAGQDANFGIEGQLRLTAIKRGEIELRMWRLQSESTYSLQASLTDDTLNAHLSLHEMAQGPLAKFAGLRNQKPLNLEASLEGPLESVHNHVELKLDDLQALLDGKIDFVQTSADLALTATAPAMQLRQDLAWRALALNLQLRGPFKGLNVSGGLHIDGLNAAQTAIGSIAIKLQGTGGRIDLDGELADLRLPASQSDFLQAVPLVFRAKLGLDKPDYPIAFELKHPLIAVTGQATNQEDQLRAEMALTLPDLQPVAALGGLQMAGNGKLALKFAQQGVNSRLEAAGMLSTSSNNSSWAQLLGGSAKFDLLMDVQGKDIATSRLHLDGKAMNLSANGGLTSGKANFNWQAQLNDLSAIVATYSGQLAAQGQLIGELDDLMLSADLKGKLANKDYPSGPITANVQLQNLPHAPNGRIKLAGVLFQAPIDVKLAVNSPDNKTIRLVIDKADWKSAHAQGGMMFTQGSPLPVGKIEMKIIRLADLQPLLNRPLSGSVNALLESAMQGDRPQAKLRFDAKNSGVEGIATVDSANLELTVSDPAGIPRLNGLLSMDGISAGKLNGSAQLKLDGPLDALALHLSAFLPNLSASEARLRGAVLLNSHTSSLVIKAMQASWHEQTVRLLAPAKVDFNTGLKVDRLRLGLQEAELELGGRFSPELALTAELHQTSAKLLSLFSPNLAMTGTLHADAKLNGSLQLPTGLIRLNADKLQMQHGPGRALPPARFIATAMLHGDVADLDAKLNAGKNISVQIDGQAPMTNAGLFDLHSEASLDLKQLDPILTAGGRRMHGQLVVNTKLAGPWSLSSLTGNAQINQGEWQDYATGTEISDITAVLTAADGTLRLAKLQAHAGPGTLSATGSLGLLSEGFPLDLTIAARNARPLASDRLTVNLDADVVLGGLAAKQMTASGRIRINRAEIRIPERIPASIAVLKLSNAVGMPPPPKANNDITLNLAIDAPRKVFIRGRGLYAELGGMVNVAGTTNNPRPDGEFKLRSGQFTLAGQTLVFNQGSIGFDSDSLTDPSLNFVATTSRNNITASLTVTGSAQHPKIVLSSTPILPQDEILANLLFGKGTANLSPLEMVQIASTLASLTGVTTGIDDPLEGARKRLGLDRLSVGGANPSLEAGRYLAPGVYLGAKQGISGGTPQATIQIDVSKRLKLEGGVGTGAAPSSGNSSSYSNSIGVIYQFEY